MAKSLKLVFSSDKDKSRLLTIFSPVDNLDDSKVNQAMDEIIASEVLNTSDGRVTRKKEAYIESKEKLEFNIG